MADAAPPGVRVHNQVAVALVAVGAAVTLAAGFVELAPNRLVSGRPVALWAAAPAPLAAALAALAASLVALALARPRPVVQRLAALVAGALLLAALAAAGAAATRLAATGSALAAVSLGPGFWAIFACSALALIDALQRAQAGPRLQLAAAALLVLGFLALAEAGALDALSLAHEYVARRDSFAAAVLRHLALVAAAVGLALAIGVPLALLALRRRRFETALFATLNLLQTVPSIALFGLLIVPLSALVAAAPALAALGVAGVGPVPAVIALVLYALLPIARNTVAGLAGVPAATVDAAFGMGMTRRQVFWQVEVPLALPVLVAGLRIVTVQAIGLAVVAALIGAGGLGGFVFEGLGQYATDLVLLGALPAIALALAADFLLRLGAAALSARFAP